MELWEVLVPKSNNSGEEISIEVHKKWDAYVKTVTGGLTIMRSAKGIWVGESAVYEERMIPVRIACNREDINRILAYTKLYYEQEAVFACKVSEEVIIYR